METPDHGPEDVGQVQAILQKISPRSEKIGHNRKKRRLHRDVEKRIWWTTSPSRRALWGNRGYLDNHAGNADKELRAGSTATSQFIPYQLELSGNGTVGIDDCDHERHAGAIEDNRFCTNKPKNPKKETLLLEEEITLTGSKPAHQRKWDTKITHTTRK